jgi:hypothetical protein
MRGRCLCGAIRFEIEAARSLKHCPCVNCRELIGVMFADYVHADVAGFRMLADGEPIQRFQSTPLHVFVGSKAPWWEITDGLPQDDKWVPGCAPRPETEVVGVSSIADHRSVPSA